MIRDGPRARGSRPGWISSSPRSGSGYSGAWNLPTPRPVLAPLLSIRREFSVTNSRPGSKSHHYVPASYLSRFTDQKGFIHIWDRARSQARRQRPNKVMKIDAYSTAKPGRPPVSTRMCLRYRLARASRRGHRRSSTSLLEQVLRRRKTRPRRKAQRVRRRATRKRQPVN